MCAKCIQFIFSSRVYYHGRLATQHCSHFGFLSLWICGANTNVRIILSYNTVELMQFVEFTVTYTLYYRQMFKRMPIFSQKQSICTDNTT